jgi:hypothetical protein
MPLGNATERRTLERWSILKAYERNRRDLVQAARLAYVVLAAYGGSPPPDPRSMQQAVVAALLATPVFTEICVSREHARPVLYPTFALFLARHILDTEWPVVSGLEEYRG